MKIILRSAAALLGLCGSLHAVIISNGDGSSNTTAPAGISGWDYVGQVNGASGVYLGDRWVLTAYHVASSAPASFNLPGYGTFSGDGTSFVRLLNADNTPADLVLFRLSSDPGLGYLTLATATPASGSLIYMAGYGFDRQTTFTTTTWYVDTDTNPYTWSETPTAGWDASAIGYKYASGHTKRWGTNTVSVGLFDTDAGFGKTTLFGSDFSQFGTAYEAQVANGDSGGAVFDSSNRLVGIMDLKGPFSGQPSNSAVFGNESYFADIATYQSQIAAVVPEPAALGLLGATLLLAHRPRRGCIR